MSDEARGSEKGAAFATDTKPPRIAEAAVHLMAA